MKCKDTTMDYFRSPADAAVSSRVLTTASAILHEEVQTMRVLICGDRNWTDRMSIYAQIAKLPKGSVIIEGEAWGADRLAREGAEACGFEVLRFPARWETNGRAAGPIRNKQMLDVGRPDVVWAFHDDITASKGTRDMVFQAMRAGVPVRLFTSHGEEASL